MGSRRSKNQKKKTIQGGRSGPVLPQDMPTVKRFEHGPKINAQEDSRRKMAERQEGLNDAPANVGLLGPKPSMDMRWKVESWNTTLSAWQYEAYTRTKEEAQVLGGRLGTFGQKWRHERVNHIGEALTEPTRRRSSRTKKRQPPDGLKVTQKTEYDRSTPRPPVGRPINEGRSREEMDLANLIRKRCAELQRACPGGLDQKPLGFLQEWAQKLGIDST